MKTTWLKLLAEAIALSFTEGEKLFALHVKPLLADKCLACHDVSSNEIENGLDLRRGQAMNSNSYLIWNDDKLRITPLTILAFTLSFGLRTTGLFAQSANNGKTESLDEFRHPKIKAG